MKYGDILNSQIGSFPGEISFIMTSMTELDVVEVVKEKSVSEHENHS